jgi:3-deoxy-D-manno-octulosonic-acid transferase
MARLFYSLLGYCLIPVIIGRLFFKGFKSPDYWKRWSERFGFFKSFSSHQRIWIHAVSFGEVQASVPLIKALQQKYSSYDFLITTMTPTGAQQAKTLFGETITHLYLPYDLWHASFLFVDRTKPTLGIIIETELWSNLFHACKKRHIPLFLINARLSEKSFQKYQQFIPSLTKQTLKCLTHIAAQTIDDKRRLEQLGANNINITGNLKFDIEISNSIFEKATELRKDIENRPIWIAASTHEGEETIILNVHRQIQRTIPNVLLVLVPRHPERFNQIFQLCEQREFKTSRRSLSQKISEKTDIYLGDTMGELLILYAAADVAFVGGSLIPRGGHNLIEPAMLGKPILTGQFVFNFTDITKHLLETNAAVQILDEQQLVKNVLFLLINPFDRQQMGYRGKTFVESNRGALEKVLKLISVILN